MQSYYIKPKSFYDSLGDVQPSQPYSYAYGDRPVFEFVFLPNEIAEGDTLVFAVDNDMVFYDSTPENLLHSASCMVVVRHYVTAEEATAGKVQMRIETRTLKFRDVTNGKVRPVEVISGLYRRRGDGDDISYVLLARGRAFANGIIADYDALPEPITTDEYYTKGDIDGLLGEKADESALVAHTDNADIHVTMQDKTTWDSKADIGDIGNATVTITQDGETRGSFSVNATDSVTIDLTGGAQADWNETDTTSPAYIQHKPSVYTKTETDALLDAKADKASVYTKGETDGLLDAKVNVATTLSGYGIQDAYTKDETNGMLDAKADKTTTLAGYGIADAYTKTEVDAKVTSVYRYKGTVSTYADLPSSGQEVGDVWNIETDDSTHGIKAGDNVAWNGSVWDALAGEIDLSAYATKTDLETKLDAPATGTVGQVLTKTADGQAWADAPAGGGVDADTMQAIEDLSVMLDSHTGISTDTTNYLRLVATKNNHVISIGVTGFTGNDVSLEYSIDKIHWFEFNPVTTVKSVALNAGQCMYLRGNNNSQVLATNDYSAFFGDYILDGDMKSLWSKTLEPEYTLTSCSCWFKNCGIVGFGNNFVPPDLSHVTTINNMFESAQLLTTLPSNFSIPIGVTDCGNMFYKCKNLAIPVGFTIPNGVTSVQFMLGFCFIEEIPALPASVVNASWYASYGKGSSSPSRLAAGFKFPEGCKRCSYALYDRCISSLPDGFTIPSTITDDGQAFKGNHPLTTVGNNVSFLKQDASWSKDYIPYNTITTIGDNFTLLCNNAPSTNPYVCFPNLTSLGTNCNINGTITNPA